MLLFSQNRANAGYSWKFIIAYRMGFGTTSCIPQFPTRELPRQSVCPCNLACLVGKVFRHGWPIHGPSRGSEL